MNKLIIFIVLIFISFASLNAQDKREDEKPYKKRVLESTEINLLSSFYIQDGDNSAVSGGSGTESLNDVTGGLIVSIPLNDDDILTIDGSISAYTSASSSNINPFDGSGAADPFVASSGASKRDVWFNGTASYSHSSDDRNTIWNTMLSFSNEFDYSSIGFGGGLTKLFNEKNTELSVNAKAYFDNWRPINPIELRGLNGNVTGEDNFDINQYTITGNTNYSPRLSLPSQHSRQTYSLGLGFSQILHRDVQGSLVLDMIYQTGLLSTPFQRVYFANIEDSFIEQFHLADDIERMPDARSKIAAGGRLNWFVNERIVVRTNYRFYADDWGISSHTANIEIPIKITDNFTLYPSYRFYNQTAADYFQLYNEHQSTNEFYTSDHDLSSYNANQYGFGISYTDQFGSFHIYKLGLKKIDLKFYQYNRNTSFKYSLVTLGIGFVLE